MFSLYKGFRAEGEILMDGVNIREIQNLLGHNTLGRDAAVHDGPKRLEIRPLPLPRLDVRVAHLVRFVAVLTAEITCLCHVGFRSRSGGAM